MRNSGRKRRSQVNLRPERGACQDDIFYEYKLALHRAYAEDAVAWGNEDWIRRGRPIYTPEEYEARLDSLMERIPSKLFKCRYHSFVTYFSMFKRLGWVEMVGEEPSGPQDYSPDFQPRRIYRLTSKGRAATMLEVSDLITTLYHYPREISSAKRHRYYSRRS